MKSRALGFLVGLGLASTVAFAATFNLFSPANGILKGNPNTYVTTPATSADVVATFTGTCNAGTFLAGDGTCKPEPSTGTVTSVGLTMPSGFSVANSPVTTAGTINVTTTLNGVLRGNGSGITTGNVALGSEVSGTLPVANGGTGAATLTGLLKGNGTSPFTAAAFGDVTALWSGTCDSTTALKGDGTCGTIGGGTPGGADTQVQFNDAGAFGGDSGFTYNKSTNLLVLGKPTVGAVIQGAANPSGNSANFTIRGGAPGPTNFTGTVIVEGGPGGTTSGAGGDVLVRGGAATTSGRGGNVTIAGNAAAGTNQNGGSITLSGGAPTGNGTPGNITLNAANAVSGTQGGSVTLNAGAGNNQAGGLVSINGGTGSAALFGGPVQITGGFGGNSAGAGGGVILTGGQGGTGGNGGNVTISGGQGSGAGTLGGSVTVQGGTSTSGDGGGVTILGRNATGTNQNGGNVNVTAGTATGTGTAGAILFTTGGVTSARFGEGRNFSLGSINPGPTSGANRGNLFVNGTSSSIMELGVNGSRAAYLYSDNTNVDLSTSGAGRTLRIWTGAAGEAQAASVAPDGGFYMQGATGGSKGAGTINATGLYVNGAAVGGGGRVAFAGGTGGSGTCFAGNGLGFSSCSRTGTGTWTFTHSPTLNTNTACVVTGDVSSPGGAVIMTANSNGTTANVRMYNTSGAAVDGLFSIVCNSP